LGPISDPKADFQYTGARHCFAAVLSLWADVPHDPQTIEPWLRDTQSRPSVLQHSGGVPEKCWTQSA